MPAPPSSSTVSPRAASATSVALRLARKAWRLQYVDTLQSAAWAEEALGRAAPDDLQARAWAGLVHGFHRLRYASPDEGLAELNRAQQLFDRQGDRRGQLLARMGVGRCLWVQGRLRESLELVLALRDEGLDVLRREERGMLLNGIAGCYSSLGESAQAFAYMYQALRESGVAREHGFDVVLYNNLAHELFQLGDCDGALGYLAEGISRCAWLSNPRLLSTLLTNRVACLTDLGRAGEALNDIQAVRSLPADAIGQGAQGAAYETMALAALRAGEHALGQALIDQARQRPAEQLQPDARVVLLVAEAEQRLARGAAAEAAQHLRQALPLVDEGLSLRARALFAQSLAEAHERQGDSAEALAQMRDWQRLHLERAQRASQARYQAASLQTELLRLRHERDRIDAQHRVTERAKRELEAINEQLSQKVREVQALQAELEQQAVRDVLTGLFNRRHLNDVLPALHALGQREDWPLAVVVIDLDHFKAVNDSYGHGAGDAVLRAFGQLLARRMRRSDVACRYGGEEFCLLMPRTDVLSARRKVQSLLKEWRGVVFSFRGQVLAARTFSAGIADSRALPELSAEQLLDAADDGAYAAKRLGRNRVALADAMGALGSKATHTA